MPFKVRIFSPGLLNFFGFLLNKTDKRFSVSLKYGVEEFIKAHTADITELNDDDALQVQKNAIIMSDVLAEKFNVSHLMECCAPAYKKTFSLLGFNEENLEVFLRKVVGTNGKKLVKNDVLKSQAGNKDTIDVNVSQKKPTSKNIKVIFDSNDDTTKFNYNNGGVMLSPSSRFSKPIELINKKSPIQKVMSAAYETVQKTDEKFAQTYAIDIFKQSVPIVVDGSGKISRFIDKKSKSLDKKNAPTLIPDGSFLFFTNKSIALGSENVIPNFQALLSDAETRPAKISGYKNDETPSE